MKFCESVEFEIIDIDENDTQYFVDVNGDVVAAFFGTALADQQIYSRLKETEIEDFSNVEKLLLINLHQEM